MITLAVTSAGLQASSMSPQKKLCGRRVLETAIVRPCGEQSSSPGMGCIMVPLRAPGVQPGLMVSPSQL